MIKIQSDVTTQSLSPRNQRDVFSSLHKVSWTRLTFSALRLEPLTSSWTLVGAVMSPSAASTNISLVRCSSNARLCSLCVCVYAWQEVMEGGGALRGARRLQTLSRVFAVRAHTHADRGAERWARCSFKLTNIYKLAVSTLHISTTKAEQAETSLHVHAHIQETTVRELKLQLKNTT